jgi:DNA repair protein RecN (Recombination protein N)
MLRTLSIRDFVIVDSIELEFSAGFTVFTGETGAGKSILIDALTLALGGRGDASVVREGAAKADITADFALSAAARHWLDANEFTSEDGGALLRRVIDNAGRSRAYINGIAATAAQLRELGDLLVDIHGQHAHQSLLKTEAQRELLDSAGADAGATGGGEDVAGAYKAAGARWKGSAGIRDAMPPTCCSNASASNGRWASWTSWRRQGGRVGPRSATSTAGCRTRPACSKARRKRWP